MMIRRLPWLLAAALIVAFSFLGIYAEEKRRVEWTGIVGMLEKMAPEMAREHSMGGMMHHEMGGGHLAFKPEGDDKVYVILSNPKVEKLRQMTQDGKIQRKVQIVGEVEEIEGKQPTLWIEDFKVINK